MRWLRDTRLYRGGLPPILQRPQDDPYEVKDDEPYQVADDPVVVNPSPAPAARRGIGDALGDFWHGMFPQETRRVVPPKPPTDQEAANSARARYQVAPAAEQTGTPALTAVKTRTGAVTSKAEADVAANRRFQQIQGTEQENSTPEHWQEVAKRGMDLGSSLHGEGRHEEAEEVLRKAYNAQLLAQGRKEADTFSATALDNLFFGKAYGSQRRNIAEASAPGATFSPREQMEMGVRGASPERGFDPALDIAAPIVGQLPLIVAGGAVGRGAAAVVGAGLERAGARGVGQALSRLAQPFENLASPASAGRSISTVGELGTRIADEVATLRLNANQIMARGATEGQVVGGIQQYQMAREQGMSPEQALAAAAEGVGISLPIGVLGEFGVAALGRAAHLGYDPIGRATASLNDRLRGRDFNEQPVLPNDRRASVDLAARAGDEPLGPQPPDRGALLNDLGTGLEDIYATRREGRAGELSDVFAPVGERRPAGPEFWEGIPPEEIPRGETQFPGEPGPQPLSGERQGPRQAVPGDLRTAREIATGERETLPLETRPTDEANAFHRMQRAAEDSRAMDAARQAEMDDPNVRLEQAAQQRPGEKQGPLTLSQTLARAGQDAKAGESLAAEYHEAINKYVDALATTKDLGEGKEPNVKQQIALARARQALNAAREKYGTQFGASAVLALASQDDDLTDEEKQMVGLGGLAVLSTAIVPHEGGGGLAPQREPLVSRLRTAIEDKQAFPKKWDEPRPAADWIGKLKGSNAFTKAELALMLPKLEEASVAKRKVGRADLLQMAEETVPRIERVTLSRQQVERGEGNSGNADEIVDIDDIDHTNPDHIQEQITNRESRISDLENEIESETESARQEMESAESEMERTHGKLVDRVEEAGLSARSIDGAIDHLREVVESEHVPRNAVDKAMEAISDDLMEASGDPEGSLRDNGYTWEQEDEPPPTYKARVRVKYDPAKVAGNPEYLTMIEKGPPSRGTRDVSSDYTGRHTLDDGMVEDIWNAGEPKNGGRPMEEHLQRAREIYGPDAEIDVVDNQAEIDEFEPHPNNREWVVRNREGKEISRNEYEEDAIKEAADDEGYGGNIDELYTDVKSLLEEYAQDLANYQARESEHYYRSEGDAFDEQTSEIDKLRDEIGTLESSFDEAVANQAAPQMQPDPNQLALGAGDEGRPPGEPVAVVPAPDEPLHNIIPKVHGNAEYASYQRIGGGTNYREMLNVWENKPDDPYTRGHYTDWQNVVGHVRAEDHRVVIGAADEALHVEGDSEQVRVTKAHVIEKRKARDKILAEMAVLAHRHGELPEADQQGPRAHELAREYKRLNQQAIDLSQREEQLLAQVRAYKTERGPEPSTVAVLIESQSDWSQDANKFGIKQELTPELKEQVGGISDRIAKIQEEIDAAGEKYNTAEVGSQEETDALAERDALRVLRRSLTEERDEILLPTTRGVPTSPFIDTATVVSLNAARFLMDAAERGYDHIAWSDAANRVKNAGLPMQAARINYDELTPAAMKRLLAFVGFKDVSPKKIFIKGEGHWHIELTPAMRRAIRRSGLPILGLMALAGDAEAQTGDEKQQQSLNPYLTAAGGIAAGAALMAMAKSKKLRSLVKENAELRSTLMVDDLSGLANKKAFTRAQHGVDADSKFHWVVFDANRFKKLNDVHGHAEGDKAIQHFGRTVQRIAEEMDIPMRGFRFGGDEIAFAAPVEHAAEFMKRVEEASSYKKGDVETSLTGGYGRTFETADAELRARKETNRSADPSLKRTPPISQAAVPESPSRPLDLHANPIPQALRELARYPSAAALAGVGVLLLDSQDKDIHNTGVPVLALAALSAIGARRIAAGKDKLASSLVEQLTKSDAGTSIARFFNPDMLLTDDVKNAVRVYEADRSRAAARGTEVARRSKALGPQGDRAVSDIIEGEQWEDTTAMTPSEIQAAVTVAAALDAEYQTAAAELLQTGARTQDELLPNYGGPRRYAYYEAQAAQLEGGPPNEVGGTPRIKSSKHRTLDEPIRAAEATLAEAQQTGDPQMIRAAQDMVDEQRAIQMSKRVELGEIRESSYRAAQGIERAYTDAAAARLFETVRGAPGVVHPDWTQAADDLQVARAMMKSARTQADRDAAKTLVNDALVRINAVTREFQREGGDYVALPDTRSLGMLRGAVVQRDVANTLTGFTKKGLYSRVLRSWKEIKTVFNPGTHQGNILSNISFAHMEGLHLWEQPAYLKRAAADMRKYGPATKALSEAGILDVNAVSAEGEGVAMRDMRRTEGLEELVTTTRPETADVLRREGITEVGAQRKRRRARYKGALAGAALGAAKMYDDENPEDAALGAAAGAGLGALVAGRGRGLRTLYNNEDNIFRAAIWLKKVNGGMTPDEATTYTRGALGEFRTRSPALNMLRSTVAPFILYPAKALPRFAAQVVDHPWRYMALIALWGGLNEYAEDKVGEVPESDLRVQDRRSGGYILPGFTQLPFSNKRGDKAGVDIARWTPLSAATSAAPPGSVPASFDENLPDIFRAGGPVVDLAARFGANVDPYSGKPAYARDYPIRENVASLLNDVSGTMLPSALDFHTERIKEDIENRDFDKLKNDALGPTGLRPRFVRPGGNLRASANQLENSLREMKQDFRRTMMNNQNPARVAVLRDRYLRRVEQALTNFRERVGQEPPVDLVRSALSPDE